MQRVIAISDEQIHEAAVAANDTYDSNRAAKFDTTRIIKQFWLIGDLVACTRVDKKTDTAYVAVRGTRELGNWIFTNFQGYYTRLQVVDDSLRAKAKGGDEGDIKFQGGTLRVPVAGNMHQGFIRAFSWLWYGTEPILGIVESAPLLTLKRALKYLTIFFGPLTAWYIAKSLGFKLPNLEIAALWCMALAMLVICMESGVVEGIFRKLTPPEGVPLSNLVEDLNSHRTVVFTGHSLGGAIAAVLFAVYRRWCTGDALRRDNGFLVTFGSGRLGDERFVRSFENLHDGRMIHFEHPGDPVPQIPPNGLFELIAKRYPIRGLGGLLISIAFIPWTVYKYTYWVPRPARWSGKFVDTMGQKTGRRLCLTFHSMSKVYMRHTKS